MDAFIYALVLVPALTELLPRSGVAVTPGNIGYYGSVLQALFLLGWGLSMAWGPIADRFGRVRALILTILFYSVFTFMCGLVTNIWQLARAARAVRDRPGRRTADGRHVRGGGVAGGSPQDGRRLHAHRLLLRLLPRRAGELLRSARTTGGDGCSSSAARPRCSSAGSRAACASRRPGRTRRQGKQRPRHARGVRRRCSRRSTSAARSSTRCCSPCRSSGCGRARSTCPRP